MTDLVTSGWSNEQLELIKGTIAKNATDDELKLFLYRCKSLNLDPLKPGQIHFVKYSSNSPGTIVVGIEGFRSKAARTGKLAGIKRAAILDEKGNCIGAWAEVYRSDWKEPAREEVPFKEYAKPGGMWQKMPQTMIKKCAEAAALRMAFPDDLGGLYIFEEMDQATPLETKHSNGSMKQFNKDVDPELIPPDPTNMPIEEKVKHYLIPKGKYAKRKIHEIAVSELQNYLDYLADEYAKRGKDLDDWIKELFEVAEYYMENKKEESK